MTAAVKALIPGNEPKVGLMNGTFIRLKSPARAANDEPMMKVMLIMKFIFTPISCAASLSSETASMARPVFVNLTKRVRASITITVEIRVMSVL